MYALTFERTNWSYTPGLEERVIVILDTTTPHDDSNIELFDEECWSALWFQYPLWACPYNQGNPPPNAFEKVRHGFSSPFLRSIRKLD